LEVPIPPTDRKYRSKNGLGWHEWVNEAGILCLELTGEGFLTDNETEKFRAEFLDESNYEILIEDDVNVYLPPENSVFDMFAPADQRPSLEDRLFLVFRKGVIDLELCKRVFKAIKSAAKPSKNRGIAGGKIDPARLRRNPEETIVLGKDGVRAKYISKDGVLSKTVEANMVRSGIFGFYPATTRMPFARMTSWTKDHLDRWDTIIPLFQRCAELFKEVNPIRYANQMAFINDNNLAENGWTLPETPYSTITVNRNYVTACHQDSGDLKSGFENFVVLEGGKHRYEGAFLCFPKFRVAFNARTGDYTAMDVAHHWHGNMPIRDAVEGEDKWVRVSMVMYVRDDLAGAGSQEEEGEKRRIWSDKYLNPEKRHKVRLNAHHDNIRKDEEFTDAFEV
jgi:hypothetical protein